jgi:proteasome accessory factor A
MEHRVYGLENEYVILYEPAQGETGAPGQRAVYQLLEAQVCERYPALPARGVKGGVFLGNGARLHYEARLERYEEGLAELNTPECRSARELCVYHRALDEILRESLPAVRARLAAQGWRGRLTFAKANVDRDGHTFGATENYLVDDPLGLAARAVQVPGQALFTLLSLVVHGLALLPLLLGAVLLVALFTAGVALLPLALLAALTPGEALSQRVSALWDSLTSRVMALFDSERTLAWLGAYTNALFLPVVAAYSAYARALYLRRHRRLLVPFLVTRTLYAGNGRVDFSEGTRFFRLSSRADFIQATCKVFWNDRRKPLLDVKHLFLDLREAWRRRKRLAVLYSDGHLCEEALHVSAGAAGLVLEAIEAGAFACTPEVRLADPVGSLHTLNGDTTLRSVLRLVNGEEVTALMHQRRYLDIVRGHLSQAPIVDLLKIQVLRAWDATLEALERDPAELDGAVDWVTKRLLLEEVAGGPEALDALGRWARALHLLDRADLDDDDLEAEGEEFWLRLARRMQPGDRADLEAEMGRAGLDRHELPEMARLAYQVRKVDMKYHDLDPEEGYAALLAAEGALGTVVTRSEIAEAQRSPPAGTRAHARGRAIVRAAQSGHRGKAGWHTVRDYDARETVRFPDPLSPDPRPPRED